MKTRRNVSYMVDPSSANGYKGGGPVEPYSSLNPPPPQTETLVMVYGFQNNRVSGKPTEATEFRALVKTNIDPNDQAISSYGLSYLFRGKTFLATGRYTSSLKGSGTVLAIGFNNSYPSSVRVKIIWDSDTSGEIGQEEIIDNSANSFTLLGDLS